MPVKNKKKVESDHNIWSDSIVNINNTSLVYNFEKPYLAPSEEENSGTGFIISKNFILTNAHVIENHYKVSINFDINDMNFDANVLVVDYDCDLALLSVTSNISEFKKRAKPLTLGDKLSLGQNLSIVGFPIGGDRICITKGVVSRIDVDEYSSTSCKLLVAQVDASINSGNSGGPAICSNGKVIGVAFQTYDDSSDNTQNIGYIITPEIIKHFISEALEQIIDNKPYKGFPNIYFEFQHLSSDITKKLLKLPIHESGILINNVTPLCEIYGKLRENDILVSIDGYKISNSGKIDLENIKAIDFRQLIALKNIGEKVKFGFYRYGKYKEADVILKNTFRSINLTGTKIFDKGPTFFIYSGIVFRVADENFLELDPRGINLNNYYSPCVGLLSNAEKSYPDEQVIFVNEVLTTKHTSNYHNITDYIIDSVNKKPIRNIKELISELLFNEGPHFIKFKCNEILYIQKMPLQEQDNLYKIRRILKSNSEDLDNYIANFTKAKEESISNGFIKKKKSKTKDEPLIFSKNSIKYDKEITISSLDEFEDVKVGAKRLYSSLIDDNSNSEEDEEMPPKKRCKLLGF